MISGGLVSLNWSVYSLKCAKRELFLACLVDGEVMALNGRHSDVSSMLLRLLFFALYRFRDGYVKFSWSSS